MAMRTVVIDKGYQYTVRPDERNPNIDRSELEIVKKKIQKVLI